MKDLKTLAAPRHGSTPLAPASVHTLSHREATITALDPAADVTDWYAFVSYESSTSIHSSNPPTGPTTFHSIRVSYEMEIDNNHHGIADIVFQVRFTTEIRLSGVTGFVGGIAGIPQINRLDGPGFEGLSLRQHYTVAMIKNGVATILTKDRTVYANAPPPFHAVPRQKDSGTARSSLTCCPQQAVATTCTLVPASKFALVSPAASARSTDRLRGCFVPEPSSHELLL
jgi:hypothetical protein